MTLHEVWRRIRRRRNLVYEIKVCQ